jgi:TrmH family RNA methyltransferase
MMTIAKLRSLKNRTCVRKTALLFHEQARIARRGEEPDRSYLEGLCSLFPGEQFGAVLSPGQLQRLARLEAKVRVSSSTHLAFACEDIHQFLLSVLGSEPSDWDFLDEEGALDGGRRTVLPHILVLDRIRSPFNVGSVFRSADSFGIEEIWLVEGTADVDHPRCVKTARGCLETVPHRVMGEEALLARLEEQQLPLFALELGGSDLAAFSFPRRGAAVIGSEEFGVSPGLLAYANDSLGRVSIRLGGTKGSLNVSVATGIMLWNWFAACR